MKMQSAIENSRIGTADGLTKEGMIAADVVGPAFFLSDRKRRKRTANTVVTFYSPPFTPGIANHDVRVTKVKIGNLNKRQQSLIRSLNWQSRLPRDPITRLGDIVR